MGVTVLRNPTVNANVLDFGADNTGANDSTNAFNAAMTLIKNAGKGNLLVPTGNYLIPEGWVISNASNFTIRADRGANIWIGPSTVGSPGRSCHNVITITDCTDFTLDGIGVDGRRDTIAADQYLASNAASGQKNITVQDGTKYVIGEALWLMGGLTANGGTEKTYNQSNLIITNIVGNVLTVNNNLSNTYTGTGASGGAWVTRYQTGGVVAYTVAGRSLGNEDAQNGIHLITCQRFTIRNCTAVNVWESPIKMGTGFQTTTPTDGCSYGIVTGNMAKHGFDQGVSVWNSQYITVTANKCDDAGWAGISFTHCNDCVATGNTCVNNVYSPAFDLNEGTGIAVEGGVRCVVTGNVCSSNNSNGIRLNISPLYGGASLSQGVSGSLAAGATAITLSGANSAFVIGGSYTIVDPNNSMNRETIYVTNVVGTAVTISPPLRNAYASGPTIFARFGEDVLVTGNICSLQALGAGIHADQQTNLRVFSNDCSKNGFLNGAFADTQGTYGIHLHSYCEQAVVEANTCSYNAQEGIVIDNNCRGVVVQANSACNNGISGTSQKMGIKLYGAQDTTVLGNVCNFNTHTGIYTQDGNVHTDRVTIVGNTCLYNNTSGIWLDNQGTNVHVLGNKIAYNNDVGIKVLGYQNCLFQGNQCYNQNGQEGIRFDDNGSNYCLDNRVFDNELFDNQGSPTQSYGFRELNNSARTLLRGNRTYGNTTSGISKSSTSTPCNIAAPAVPASTVAYTNTTTYDCTVIITGGTVTVIAVGGVTTGLTSGTVRVPVGETITITYTGVPTWKWYAD